MNPAVFSKLAKKGPTLGWRFVEALTIAVATSLGRVAVEEGRELARRNHGERRTSRKVKGGRK